MARQAIERGRLRRLGSVGSAPLAGTVDSAPLQVVPDHVEVVEEQ
jgi:hypothetical protein